MRNSLLTNVLAMVLAGGEGTRLYPLTKERCKPAVPFGSRYRIIDFVLSNLINSGILKINVLTQYKAHSLIKHIQTNWALNYKFGFYVNIVPPQMRIGKIWFRGTADAIYQNLNLIFDEQPDYVIILSSDHIYTMDIKHMIDYHIEKKADITVATFPIDLSEASRFGIMKVDKDNRIISFAEKPSDTEIIYEYAVNGKVLASMGNYVFNRDILIKILEQDALKDTSHDFGKNIIPESIEKHRVFSYSFDKTNIIGSDKPPYWRDVGTIKSFFDANMELLLANPPIDLYNPYWPIYSAYTALPAAKIIGENVNIQNSIIAEGCLIENNTVIKNSIIFPKCHIKNNTYIENSIIMDGCIINPHSVIIQSILDKGVIVDEGIELTEENQDKFIVSEGIIVIPKGQHITKDTILREKALYF
ncbi:MAG: glucose-1-phosphate adenylyltransferase [Candidatus Calescibacterium sp.]|nr:glucose-1-phosphate adenylyltransferase [Candidatus Calescibacterium sp.]MCX7972579.1 glucose-1-phosphate adenylyltransferase [bacterium]MDW8195786.1 glucose-1-phosphate adenylyltransferase [Candidatus Calescibacterium sp.]